MHNARFRLAPLFALLLAGIPALAQAETGTQGGAPPAGQSARPEQKVPETGVIHPPAHVDPGMTRATPPVGSNTTEPMPVIRPPGSPGGNPNVIPK